MISSIRSLRTIFALLVCFPAFVSLHAQVQANAPVSVLPQYEERWDIYGGFAASHFNPGAGISVPAIWLKGWNGDATAWLKPAFGLEFSARGFYGTIIVPPNNLGISTSNMSEHLFLVGPNVRMLRRENYAAGMHLLMGAADGSFDQGFKGTGVQPYQLAIYNNKVAYGMAIGGWMDYNLNPRWSVRVTTDWQPTHYGYITQNEFAGTVGLVYKVGHLR
ncbi:hypothetical protein [Pseudacidobacterium ailaaui]|uniref:hypothetical protein n=1 Tax=Pseudacidobacterium ailaaui TaxID=1382359 RepID=UPI00047BDD92|nr:hypothetical protein [Pseudacidobacterium ailaaui]MBX6361725.1 hypothetical protein [Pseudacidobacterium ailaaui]MCL6464233.1 hypothetical protein [Pseudacidobacterium ailaaui]MDI3254726.1 hypothetical protein [Bacillota bacterium]